MKTSYGPTLVRITGPVAGPALVLLHGAGATSLIWAPNVCARSEEFRTLAVDQVGEFGKSICTKPLRSLTDLVAWLDELFAELDLVRGINLLGIPYGVAFGGSIRFEISF